MAKACIRCGLVVRGTYDSKYICTDCLEFSPVLLAVWEDAESQMRSSVSIDPTRHLIFRLLADVTFVAASNMQLRIFYNACELLVSKAIDGHIELTEADLVQALRTTRSRTDLLKVLEDAKMVKIRPGPHGRSLVFEERLMKMAKQFMDGSSLELETIHRHAHIYAGFILLYLLTKVAGLSDAVELDNFPYGCKPRTLWNTLMFLWSAAYRREKTFKAEDLRRFLAKRGIMSHVADSLARRLQMLDGKTVQSLIKGAEIKNGDIEFEFQGYVLDEMKRLRELTRGRERGDSR